jgi:hypothetical protein
MLILLRTETSVLPLLQSIKSVWDSVCDNPQQFDANSLHDIAFPDMML